MSKIYTNAVIHTEDPKNPQADTVVIENGKFTYVGKAEGYPIKPEDEAVKAYPDFTCYKALAGNYEDIARGVYTYK